MKLYFKIIILFSVLYSCKPYKEMRTVEYMYQADYEKQRVLLYPAIENENAAISIAKCYFTIGYEKLQIDFNNYESIKAVLVNKETIWKIKMIRQEQIGGILQPAHYYCYLRKVDGAILLIRRETGERIGNTDMEEGYFKINESKN